MEYKCCKDPTKERPATSVNIAVDECEHTEGGKTKNNPYPSRGQLECHQAA